MHKFRAGNYTHKEFFFKVLVILFFLTLFTLISAKVNAATFTVDSTGDETDLSNDGLCLTSLGTCTLRAAIVQANNVAGTDNIYFNIPTSDPGYRDYDNPDTPSSGDSIGGDDYWTIKPLTLLPHVAAVMDGATQETNSGFDRNIYGPDIELNGSLTANPGAGDTHIVTFNGTNSAVNKIVFNSFTYGGGIGGYGNGFTVTRNYVGTDVKGMVKKDNGTGGIGLNQATNVIIGNDVTDGNIITATSYGIYNGCTNPNPHKISGNRIGIAADGVTPLPMVTAIFMHTNCNSIIGGDTEEERNYIAATTSFAIRFEGNINATTAVHQIYNNYLGTDVNGNVTHALEIKDAAIADVFGGDYVGYKTITIGAPGKGNLIANSKYGIRLFAPNSIVSISNNTIVKTRWSIYGYKTSIPSPDTATWVYANVSILNNYISDYANPDPYFGLTFAKGDWSCTNCSTQDYISAYGINLAGFNGVIKGNKIVGNAFNAIWVEAWSNVSNSAIIGGQNALSGSLCQGLEKNCIEGNGVEPLDGLYGGAVLFINARPANINTIYADNYFGSGNGYNSNENVSVFGFAAFDLLSGTNRRTDLANQSLTIPIPSTLEVLEGWGGIYADDKPGATAAFTNYKVACSDESYCPASGSSSGEEGNMMTFLSKDGYEGYNPAWFPGSILDLYIYTYLHDTVIDNSGNVINKYNAKFEENHFASQNFSFDGDSTTDAQPYPGISEVWTDNDSATRADTFNTHAYSTAAGWKQVMQVQYVDANPIRQNDGSFIIYVDSATDEDNVSTCGFDDGYGAYSGGGCGGIDGLPDGKTSLREAMFVANSGLTPLKIEFNIPTSDTGYRDYDNPNTNSSGDSTDGDDYFLITIASSLPDIVSFKDVTIDGLSQETNSGNNRNTFGPDILISGGGVATNIFKTLTNEATKNLLDLTITGLIINNVSNNLVETNINYISASGTETLTLTNNYFCTDAKGLGLTSNCTDIGIYSNGLNGSLNISNNLFGWSGSSSSAIRASTPTDTTSINITNNKFGTNSQGTLSTKPLSGYGMLIESTNSNNNVLIQGNIINTDQGTCIFGRRKLTIDNNYCGTDVTGNTIFTVSEIYTEGMATITNNVAARIIILETGGDPVSVSNNTIGVNKSKTTKFNLTRFEGAGQTAPSAANLASVEAWTGIGSFTGNYIASTHNGLYIKSLTSPSTINVNNNTFNDIAKSAIRMKDQKGLSISNNIFTNIAAGNQVIDFLQNNVAGQNINDSGDTDSYASDTYANDAVNFPVIQKISYIGGGKYKLEGILDNNVAGEAPFDLEICLSTNSISTQANCSQSLFYQANYITQIQGGLNPWQAEVTVAGSDGTDNPKFSALATNNYGYTSEISTSVSPSDVTFVVQSYPITLISPTNNQTITSKLPLLKWQASTDADLKQYAVYINGAFYATVSETNTQLQIQTDLANANYTWYVVAIRNNNTESGRSSTFTFKVDAPNPEENIPTSYPTLTPISETPTIVSFPLSYTQVSSQDKSNTQNLLTSISEFFLGAQTSISNAFKAIAPAANQASQIISPITPLVGGVILGITAIPATISLPQLGILLGAYVQRRKRYFGLVYDINSKDIVPLANIELLDQSGKLVDKSISDFKGRYSLSIDNQKDYTIRVKAEGYQTKELPIKGMYQNNLITFDIDLKRLEGQIYSTNSSIQPRGVKVSNFVFRTLRILTILGFLYSALIFATSPTLVNGIIIGVYAIVFGVNIYIYLKNKSEKASVILNEFKKPLKGVIFKIIAKDGNIVDTGITKEDGVMKVRLEQGSYSLFTNLNGNLQTQEIKVNNRGFIEEDIVVKENTQVIKQKSGLNTSLEKDNTLNPFS